MILKELAGKTKEEMIEVLDRIDRKETEAFMEGLIPAIKKDFEKGIYSDLDIIIKLCRETFRCGLSKGIELGIPEVEE